MAGNKWAAISGRVASVGSIAAVLAAPLLWNGGGLDGTQLMVVLSGSVLLAVIGINLTEGIWRVIGIVAASLALISVSLLGLIVLGLSQSDITWTGAVPLEVVVGIQLATAWISVGLSVFKPGLIGIVLALGSFLWAAVAWVP